MNKQVNEQPDNGKKKCSTWEMVFRIIIAISSAFLGVLSGQAMNG